MDLTVKVPDAVGKRVVALAEEKGWTKAKTLRYLLAAMFANAPVQGSDGKVIAPNVLCDACPMHQFTRTLPTQKKSQG